jgi:type II secretory pathway predicted ATPase ExeA
MYEKFFGLGRRPFAAAPDADCYFPATAIEAARQTLFRCIDRGEGPALLIGPAGAGKSLLLQVLAEQFIARFELALLASGRLTTLRELLQAILYELRLEYRELQEGELRLALIDHLSGNGRLQDTATRERGAEGLLLLIDEAHTLPLKLLEEIRLITNLIRGGQPKVRLVLAGSPALEERFTSPKLDAFNQRVSARCYLAPFDRQETFEYIKAQIEWAAGQPDRLFTSEALDAVYQATGGVPRLINQICDHALYLACGAGVASLDKPSIESAWADLQQLPAPANRDDADVSQTGEGHVIEFGVLDDASSNEYDIEIEPGLDAVSQLSCDESPTELQPSEYGFPDPLRSLNRVEQQIAAIDSDYESEVATGPQIDLSFESNDSAFNPFSETFAEEELVIDPFAMTATDALANRPVVQCAEGHNLAALLKPLPDHPVPKLAIAEQSETLDFDDYEIELDSPGSASDDELSIESAEPMVFEVAQETESNAWPAVALWPPVDDTTRHDEKTPSAYATYRLVADSKATQQRTDTAHKDYSHEPDLIVIEDEPPSVHQVTVVGRGQFRRLFSSMRRG